MVNYNNSKLNAVLDFFKYGKAVSKLMAINIFVFIFFELFQRSNIGRVLFENLALSKQGLFSGYVWELFTYSFLHAGFLHIAFNMLGLYFIGRYVERFLGTKNFLIIYFSGVLLGALVWLFTSSVGDLVGASAGVMALFSAFCVYFPKEEKVSFLIFFIFPIRTKPMTMLKVIVAIEIFSMFMTILSDGYSSIAYSAHLGGIFAGYMLANYFKEGRVKVPKIWNNHGKKKILRNLDYSVNITDVDDLRSRIDNILDKINKEGIANLTEEEKQILSKAKHYF